MCGSSMGIIEVIGISLIFKNKLVWITSVFCLPHNGKK